MTDMSPSVAIRRHIIRKIFLATPAADRLKLREKMDAAEVTFLADALQCPVTEINWGDDG